MIRVATIAALVALIGAPDALACRLPANGEETPQMQQRMRDWTARLAAARKVSGTYAVEREVPNSVQRDAVDQLGVVVGQTGRIEASTFLEQANMIVVRCGGPTVTKPSAGQTGSFFLEKREADGRWLIVHFERDGRKDD